MNNQSNDSITYMPADRHDWLGVQAGSNPARSVAAYVIIDPEERKVYVDTDTCMAGTPADIWLGRRLLLAVEPRRGGVPDAAATMSWLSGEHAALITRICDGYSREWDGSNSRGRLSDDASAALAALERAMSDAPTLPGELAGVWDAGDWLELADLPTTEADDDDALAALAARLEDDALTEDVVLAGTIEYLRFRRSTLRAAIAKAKGE